MRPNPLKTLACVFLFLCQEGYAAISYGFQIGPNFGDANITSSSDTGTNDRIGFIGGFNLDIFIAGPVYLQLELNYAQRGLNVEGGQTVLGATDRILLDYIEFPMLVKGKGLYYSPNRLSFMAGPVYGYRLRSTLTNTQRHVFTFLLGLGFETDIEDTTSFFISARYSFGISNVLLGSSDRLSLKGFQFLVGLQFETLGDIFFKPKTKRYKRFKELRTKGAEYR